MPSIGIGVRNQLAFGGSSGIPFKSDLLLNYESRSGLDLIESKQGLNAKILPVCGQITSTDYATLNVLSFEGDDATGYIEARFLFNNTTNQIILFSTNNNGNTSGYFIFRITNKKPILTFRNGTTPVARVLTGTDDVVAGWNIIRWNCDGSVFNLTTNGENKTFSDTGSGPMWLSGLNSPNTRDNVTIGASILSSVAPSSETFKIDYVDYSNKHKWIVTGLGTKIFDIIGTTHLTWVGTNHIAYDELASTYLLDSGFSIWTKSGQASEYVPYKAGVPMDSSLGIIGYEKRASYNGGASIYNYAPSLVDFDYSDSANALLVAFDKSNSTYHIATAGMQYYDSSNHYRWRQDELADPRIFSELYKNVGYRGIINIKSEENSGLLKSASQLLVYLTDKKLSNQWSIAKYCTIQNIVAQVDGVPVYDVNDYLTYNALPPDITALSIAFVGDSTMGDHASGNGQYIYFNRVTQFSTYNIATTGDTINNQLTKWNLITTEQRLLFDYVLVQVGLNDLANSVQVFSEYYQTLIDKINADTKDGCKIVVSTMTPCFGFFTDPVVRQKWIDSNIAIAGGGTYAVTGFDYANLLNTSLLNDGSNFLLPAYDSGDGLHPNSSGRQVIFNNYLPYIVRS